jgi:serine phosphatase RsbU (regulator of sigma subunit)
MKFRRVLFVVGAFVLLLLKFSADIFRKNVELQMGGLLALRELAAVGAFVLIYLALRPLFPERASVRPVRWLGIQLISVGVFLVVMLILGFLPGDGFDAKDLGLLPLDYPSLFMASLFGLFAGIFSIVNFQILRDLVLASRTKRGRRNFFIFMLLVLGTAASSALIRPLDSSVVTGVLYGLAVCFALVNAFRLPWIVYLTKREKLLVLTLTFFLFVMFTVVAVLIKENASFERGLLYYSHPLQEFVLLSLVTGAIYGGMAFISTLFHLPTAEAFDRKRSELTSIHTLSKLVTQVFDFNELMETVTTMTLHMVGAQSAWIELLPPAQQDPVMAGVDGFAGGQVVGMKNITRGEIEELQGTGLHYLRTAAGRERKPIVVDEVARDPRFAAAATDANRPGSLVIVPLVSHTGLIGFLYATKAVAFGFVKDDIELISTFADQATIAIENSRLIRTSIERERLVQEMTLAQDMQRKLLPQRLPRLPGIDLDALSTPAFEVGGDYYDYVVLSDHELGIIVGDVSGKGVPAAFYMSEVKGIFQSLSPLYKSPREFMLRANTVLMESIDKHSFVSLIYGILDVRTGCFQIARAGHCPLLHVGEGSGVYLRPDGMGLGLAENSIFAGSIEEHTVRLRPGDLCVLYTDGVTEAHRNGEEFGYERLRAAAGCADGRPAARVKDDILLAVDTFIDHGAPHDDLTLVVVRWLGPVAQS